MATRFRTTPLLAVVLVAVLAVPAGAQVQDQISVYTGSNAVGYLQPLADAFGATLNDAFFYSAYIPPSGFRISLEVPVMGVIFEDGDKMFTATSEGGFMPTTTTSVPTVVGNSKAVIVPGQSGTSFAYPGGLDVNSFGVAVPQLRISSLKGTEAIVRWIAFDTGDVEFGDINLFGIGGRHSISQYLEAPPVDVSVGLMYQTFDLGENTFGNDFVASTAFSIGAQGSKRFPIGFLTFEPFTSLSFDRFKMDVEYDDAANAKQTVEFDAESTVKWTLGAGFNFVAGHLWGAYNLASTNSFSFGLALGNVGY